MALIGDGEKIRGIGSGQQRVEDKANLLTFAGLK